MRRTYSDRLKKKEFRMSIVNRIKDLSPKERSRMIDRIIMENHTIPFSKNNTLSRTTIYRWLKEYRENMNAGTVHMGKIRSDRGSYRAITEVQKDALLRWRYDNPYRTLQDLREELMEHKATLSDTIPSKSTIGRFLNEQGLSRTEMLKGNRPQGKIRLAFEAEYPQQLWMADTKGPNVYVEDPKNPEEKVAATPILYIDDNSRYVVAAAYVIVENEEAVINLFRQAVSLYGVPEKLYLDRGGPYMGKRLKRAATLIGCNIIRTPKEDPAAKGKIEKMLKTCHERFEQEMLVKTKGCKITLSEYNMYLQAYIGQDYNLCVHSETGERPEDRFFSFPAELRRWISKDNLTMIFLPVRSANVSKVGLIHINDFKYLATDSILWEKKVEVRYDPSNINKIYVWYKDQYYGEANIYIEENDFLKRAELIEKIIKRPEISLPAPKDVPIYGRLERLLTKHREELEGMGINEQLLYNKKKKEQIRADIIKKSSSNMGTTSPLTDSFNANDFMFLLMKLLRKKFTPSERFSVHTLWNSVGPIDEKLVRNSVGRLLGEEHPTDDLKGYLEEIRIAIITEKNN